MRFDGYICDVCERRTRPWGDGLPKDWLALTHGQRREKHFCGFECLISFLAKRSALQLDFVP